MTNNPVQFPSPQLPCFKDLELEITPPPSTDSSSPCSHHPPNCTHTFYPLSSTASTYAFLLLPLTDRTRPPNSSPLPTPKTKQPSKQALTPCGNASIIPILIQLINQPILIVRAPPPPAGQLIIPPPPRHEARTRRRGDDEDVLPQKLTPTPPLPSSFSPPPHGKADPLSAP